MENNFYRFQLGDFECVSVLDGFFNYPVPVMYANAPKEAVESALRGQQLPVDQITTPYNFVCINTGDHLVLVDMGAGRANPSTGRLADSLRAAGIDPLQIDTVIISHAHPDHIGGTLDEQDHLIYPHAQYFISQLEWGFWFSEQATLKAPEPFVATARKNLSRIEEQVTPVNRERELLPGILFTPAPGHTPGHAVITVRSRNEQLMYTADAALQPLHLEHPSWYPVFDIEPEQATKSKQSVFNQVAREQTLILAQHFPPFPGLGYVEKMSQGWHWEPLKTTHREYQAASSGG